MEKLGIEPTKKDTLIVENWINEETKESAVKLITQILSNEDKNMILENKLAAIEFNYNSFDDHQMATMFNAIQNSSCISDNFSLIITSHTESMGPESAIALNEALCSGKIHKLVINDNVDPDQMQYFEKVSNVSGESLIDDLWSYSSLLDTILNNPEHYTIGFYDPNAQDDQETEDKDLKITQLKQISEALQGFIKVLNQKSAIGLEKSLELSEHKELLKSDLYESNLLSEIISFLPCSSKQSVVESSVQLLSEHDSETQENF